MCVPNSFLCYVHTVKSEIPYKKITREKYTLSRDEALEDFECFKYIIDNAYSGKEYWENNGIDFADRYSKIERYINESTEIFKHNLAEKYHEALTGIHDGHLSLKTHNHNFSFSDLLQAYFADLIIQKKNDILSVAHSRIEGIDTGMRVFCERKNLFPTLSPAGKEYYLYGTRSWDKLNHISIKVEEKSMSIPVHKCRAGSGKVQSSQNAVDYDENTGILECPSFMFNAADDLSILEELYNIGKSFKDKKTVIWNLLSNGGGSSNYPMKFIEGLNKYANWKIDLGILHSPVTDTPTVAESNRSTREWEFFHGKDYDLSEAAYDGRLIVLINSLVASSGEAAAAYCHSVKNRVFIGENTMGCGTFGDTLSYMLPYSLMRMIVPYKLFLGMGREGEGFEPDYWADSEDVKGETLKWLNRGDYFPYYT